MWYIKIIKQKAPTLKKWVESNTISIPKSTLFMYTRGCLWLLLVAHALGNLCSVLMLLYTLYIYNSHYFFQQIAY